MSGITDEVVATGHWSLGGAGVTHSLRHGERDGCLPLDEAERIEMQLIDKKGERADCSS